MKTIIKTALLSFVIIITVGCRMVSPILLETPVSKSRANALPLTIGVEEITKNGSQKLTSVLTYTSFGIMAMGGKMPRRSEADYFNKSITNALRGSGNFQYVYATPFDIKDVDLTLEVKINEFVIDNGIYGSLIAHSGNIPVIGILFSLGQMLAIIPQEHFTGNWNLIFNLKNKSGKVIATYKEKTSFNDYATMWEQPFATYMWYEAPWIEDFKKAINSVNAKIKRDRDIIMKNIIIK